MDDPGNRQYTNGEITVFWRPSKCIHATTCFRELLEVFNPGKRPWINMKGAPTRRIIEVVNKCPTQALTWEYNKNTETEKICCDDETVTEEITPDTVKQEKLTDKPVRIQIMKDGPIVVEGNFKITDPSGNDIKSLIMTSFCRCGHSHSMPFCDGTHRKAGFLD